MRRSYKTMNFRLRKSQGEAGGIPLDAERQTPTGSLAGEMEEKRAAIKRTPCVSSVDVSDPRHAAVQAKRAAKKRRRNRPDDEGTEVPAPMPPLVSQGALSAAGPPRRYVASRDNHQQRADARKPPYKASSS
jgi:hypothetical protein